MPLSQENNEGNLPVENKKQSPNAMMMEYMSTHPNATQKDLMDFLTNMKDCDEETPETFSTNLEITKMQYVTNVCY